MTKVKYYEGLDYGDANLCNYPMVITIQHSTALVEHAYLSTYLLSITYFTVFFTIYRQTNKCIVLYHGTTH